MQVTRHSMVSIYHPGTHNFIFTHICSALLSAVTFSSLSLKLEYGYIHSISTKTMINRYDFEITFTAYSSKHEMMKQCCFNVFDAGPTLKQIV